MAVEQAAADCETVAASVGDRVEGVATIELWPATRRLPCRPARRSTTSNH